VDHPPGVTARVAISGKWLWTVCIPARAPRKPRRVRLRPPGLPLAGLVERFLARLAGPFLGRQRGLPAWQRMRLLIPSLSRGGRYLLRHTRVRRFLWRTRLGVPDAQLCALAAALVNLGQTAVALAASRARPGSPLEVRVHTDYRSLGLYTFVDCLATVSPVRVLIAGLLVLAELWRRRPRRGAPR